MKGELHPDKEPLFRRNFLQWMTASNQLACFLVSPLPETAMGILGGYG